MEDLVEVVEDVVVGGAGVAHDEEVGLAAGNLGDGGLVDVAVEGGDQVAVSDVEHSLACNLFLLDRC